MNPYTASMLIALCELLYGTPEQAARAEYRYQCAEFAIEADFRPVDPAINDPPDVVAGDYRLKKPPIR